MSKHWCIGVLAAVWSVAFALPASAQRDPGSIAGTVKDTTGAVLPGVTVEAASPVLIERVRSVVTDATGQFKIVDLRPGVYQLTFSLPGFSTFRRDGIELTSAFTATVNAELRIGDVTETITVSGASPVVDVQNVQQQRVMTRDVLDAIPAAKMYTSVAPLVPGITIAGGNVVNQQDVGGTVGFAFQAFNIHGSRMADMQVNFDGLWVQFPQGAGPAMMFQDGSTQEFTVNTSGNTAEGETGGVRVNIIPKEGGNAFKGNASGAFGNGSLQSDNLTDSLRARGLTAVNRLKEIWDVNVAFGGPIKKDKLWFLGALTKRKNDTYIAGIYYNADPAAFAFTPDLNRQAINDQPSHGANLRLTWQASPKNRISAYHDYEPLCYCHALSIGSGNVTPEASLFLWYNSRLSQVNVRTTATNRLLFETGVSYYHMNDDFTPQPDVIAPGVREATTGLSYRAGVGVTYAYRDHYVWNLRHTATYVTGSHALKAGADLKSQESLTGPTSPNDFPYVHLAGPPNAVNNVSYGALRGVPNTVTYFATPYSYTDIIRPNLGLFVQDQWTLKHLTLNGGLRFDYLRAGYPDEHVAATQYVPVPRDASATQVLNWTDLSPRLGLSYDPRGTGKTAVKFGINRYIIQENFVTISTVNPINQNNSIQRSLIGTIPIVDGNPVITGNPLNPAANGNLGPSPNVNFGTAATSTRYGDFTHGFGVRPYNWEVSTGVQHEIFPRVSLNAGYFWRWYGNFRVTDNTAVTKADFDPYCVTIPVDARLPGGGGQPLCGLFDINPAKFGQVRNVVNLASDYGEQYEHWQGGDLTLNARLPNGLLLQGGLSSGKGTTDNCDVVTKIGGNPSQLYCHQETPFRTQVKFVFAYLFPWKMQFAGTYQSLPGAGSVAISAITGFNGTDREATSNQSIAANFVATNAQIAPSLGRNLAAGASATATINVVPPATLYEPRLHQLDLRLSRAFRVGGTDVQLKMDVYNALNKDTVLVSNNTYGTNGSSWLVPLSVLSGRFFKFGIGVNF
jgi:Carboxypeptidase regulatory-like domain